jgi:glycosyltransferase involved in cell wall biosynthesis
MIADTTASTPTAFQADQRLSYAIVTPARNERDNLQRVADSIRAQQHRPEYWVVVDDDSDDGMRELADELARQHDWILVVGTGEGDEELPNGRLRGRELLAFRHGLRALPTPVDVFVKVDADTSFDADYFERLLVRFVEQPDLGIAGGSCYEIRDGRWERVKVADSHPRGASRAYRWELLETLNALEPALGWDGVDDVMAELRGYRTVGFLDLGFRHHRRVGEREGRMRAASALGQQGWYMGYRPSYLLLRALYRARENVASLAMVWGYTRAAATRAPRCCHPEVIERIREGQRLRVVLRRGRWS